MSLLSEAYEPFVFMQKNLVPDGYGGYKRAWTQGAEFPAIANMPNSSVSTIADKMTERVNCTITTSRAISLDEFDVIKRLSDGQVFRILSNGKDKKTPKSAGLDMRQSNAELWEIPDDESIDEQSTSNP